MVIVVLCIFNTVLDFRNEFEGLMELKRGRHNVIG